MVTTDELELIRRAQQGDAEAFCRLAKDYQRRVYTLALHYCRNPHDAEDLSQEVWLKAFKAVAGFRGEASFYTWLRQITVNTFLNHRRAQTVKSDDARTPVRLESLDEPDAWAAAPGPLPRGGDAEAGLHRGIMVERVLLALRELTPRQRLMFLLKHREGMTYAEISAAFGCSTGAVKKSLFRTVLKLRASLGLEAGAGDCVTLAAGEGD